MLCSRQRCQGQPGKARTVCDHLLGPGWLARRHQFRPGRGRLAIEAGRVRLIRRKHKTDQTRLMYCAGVATSYRLPVPLLMRMASHPLRWALLTELACGDRRVREQVVAVDAPQNLVS